MTRLLPVLTLLAACNTPCQKVCVSMYEYAQECPGVSIPESQLNACLDEQANADDQGACRAAGDAETLRDEWDCRDLEVFFDQDR